jgi:hypothetical protein
MEEGCNGGNEIRGKDLKKKEFTQSGLLAEWAVYGLGTPSPLPLFFISVDSKGR